MDKKNIEAIYPLSPAQQGMLLYLVLSEGGTDAYFEQYFCTLGGDLDVEQYRRAWGMAVERHAALRTSFLWERRERPLQVVVRRGDLEFEVEDWSDRPADRQRADLDRLLADDRSRGFKLDEPLLIRFRLIRLADGQHFFLCSYSHLLVDGWSMSRVTAEVTENYAALRRGETLERPPAPPYRRYIEWLGKRDPAEAEAFWRRTLAGADGAEPLPIDRNPGAHMKGRGVSFDDAHYQHAELDPAAVRRVNELVKGQNITANAFFQAVWGLVLARYGGHHEAMWGTTVSGRPPKLEHVEQIVGLFINALPIRLQLDEERPFLDTVRDLQMQLTEQREHEYCLLEDIQRWIGLPHDRPLFESLVIYQNFPGVDAELDLEVQVGDLKEVTNHPLVLYVVIRGDRGVLRLVYDRGRFHDGDAERLFNTFKGLFERLMEAPELPLRDLPLMAPDTRAEVVAGARSEAAPWPQDATLHGLVAAQAERTPDAVALEQIGGGELTYRQLLERSRRLAHHLRGLGVGPDRPVAVSLERGPAMVVALLGVLEAGGAYLPIDPDYPAERAAFMLEDSGADVLVTSAGLGTSWPAVAHRVDLPEGGDAFPELPSTPIDVEVGP
ncbi:MAG: condensation domain-containing protein, partial [Acidobacteriota bacterium]